jgi:pyocin large subunit-like protein
VAKIPAQITKAANGEILLYDADANIFGVFTNEGVPKTMFKPTDGIIYWERN